METLFKRIIMFESIVNVPLKITFYPSCLCSLETGDHNTLLIMVLFVFLCFTLCQQSTPVGSLQTGHEIVTSPNRDRMPAPNKVRDKSGLLLSCCSVAQFLSGPKQTLLCKIVGFSSVKKYHSIHGRNFEVLMNLNLSTSLFWS